ncbi:MAG: TIGR03960 family B12-binding radical SAM protein [Planctomycetes bacterium]|nr:TIGR03960 family B12-binding radical SAM protein [Planctomycetota bacterium]
MTDLWHKLEPHLPFVQGPSQYVGGEFNAVRKDPASVSVRVAIAFPDVYKIGMAHLGMQIFYGMINDRPDALCERIFAPWTDLEERMRRDGIPLFSVDSHRPAREFDLLGFSLQSELGYTNVVNMLDLAGIPLHAADRRQGDPIVVGGGPNGSYPEPVADFFDIVILGDGEEAVAKLVDIVKETRDRGEILRRAMREVPGAYVPRFYSCDYRDDGTVRSISALEGAPMPVKKALVADFAGAYFPLKPIVPSAEVVHDRINLEIMRGCPNRCRFCHAVNFKNKLRFRPVELLVQQAEMLYRSTGHDEIALTSLSSGDYPHIAELMTRLNVRFGPRKVSVSLPSLRVDEKLPELPRLMKTVRKSGFTVAPEAGTEELRRIIRKPIRDEDLLATAKAAFEEGWNHIKLYFMIGLPHETERDIDGIVETARRVSAVGKQVAGRAADVNVTISPMVPKPHTPFQFAAQRPFEYVEEVERRLSRLARGSRVHLKMHDPRTAYVEAVLARGDRRVGRAVVEAWKLGARFDEWSEHFRFERWMTAFRNAGIDPDFYARREPGRDEILPWDHFDVRLSKETLRADWESCRKAADERAQELVVGG